MKAAARARTNQDSRPPGRAKRAPDVALQAARLLDLVLLLLHQVLQHAQLESCGRLPAPVTVRVCGSLHLRSLQLCLQGRCLRLGLPPALGGALCQFLGFLQLLLDLPAQGAGISPAP